MRNLIAAVEAVDPLVVTGKVAGVSGLLIEARGGLSRLAVGARAEIGRRGSTPLPAEVVGFRDSKALLMPFGPVEGVAPGAEIRIEPLGSAVRPTKAWLGRIIDAFGEPIDGLGPLPQGIAVQPVLLDYGPDAASIAWVGEEHGLDNFKKVLARRRPVQIDVHFLPPLTGEALTNRKTIAATAREQMLHALHDRR